LLYVLLATARASLKPQRELALENLALRQQLAIVQRKTKRPRLTQADRAFWVALCTLWPDWQSALLIVKPETVIGWHRKGFKLYWTWKSRKRTGRPPIDAQIRTLIRQIARENPTWGAPRIHGELLMLGFEVAQATVSRYMPVRRKPPSQTWRAFLRNHTRDLVSIDFFVVPTATFRVLYVFLVLEHERRRIVHFNVTDGPCAQWTGQQLVNAFPYDSAPKHVIRDRDKIYGADFAWRVRAMGIEQVLTAPRSPWQNPYCERVVGTLRRDCLEHVIVLTEQHLRRILRKYLEYYHGSRTHLALDKDAPDLRQRESPDAGKVIALPMVGGLHHRYSLTQPEPKSRSHTTSGVSVSCAHCARLRRVPRSIRACRTVGNAREVRVLSAGSPSPSSRLTSRGRTTF
jgi:transposase InsO family protein